MVSITLTEKGFSEQLLAAVFKMTQADAGDRGVYWVYSYKRGSFYPFVPQGSEQRRDNAAELHFATIMDGELPVEKAAEHWYALWGFLLILSPCATLKKHCIEPEHKHSQTRNSRLGQKLKGTDR